MRLALAALLVPLALVALPGCGGKEESEGPLMRPGENCLGCHREFTAAGTVYASASSTQGEPGVAVVLNGSVNLTSNAAGNFYTSAALPASYTVQISKGGLTQTMTGATGACNGCHGVSRAKVLL